MKPGDEVTIAYGAIVGQDFRYFKWSDKKQVFRVDNIIPTQERASLVADGYGLHEPEGKYGNGAVFADIKDLLAK